MILNANAMLCLALLYLFIHVGGNKNDVMG